MTPVLVVDGVSKKFCRRLGRSVLYGLQDIGRELVGARRPVGLRAHEFHALDRVGFELRPGQALGLVGPNGAGKTTLLRIVSGLIRPDAGAVRIRGRVAPLIALGAGFNPVLTGRENIHVNGALLGLSRRALADRLTEIIDFAEVGDAIDAPLGTYSSGMAARLGFACAIAAAPELLLIDEVLAVGDMRFRAKCYRALASFRERGGSLVLVSHSPVAVLSICDRAAYLSGGKLVVEGPTEEVLERYDADQAAPAVHATGRLAREAAEGAGPLQLRELRLADDEGRPLEHLTSGQPGVLELRCEVRAPVAGVSVNVNVTELARENSRVLFLESAKDGTTFDAAPGTVVVRLRLPLCGLRAGAYSAKIALVRASGYWVHDAVEAFVFKVVSPERSSQSSYHQPRTWTVVGP